MQCMTFYLQKYKSNFFFRRIRNENMKCILFVSCFMLLVCLKLAFEIIFCFNVLRPGTFRFSSFYLNMLLLTLVKLLNHILKIFHNVNRGECWIENTRDYESRSRTFLKNDSNIQIEWNFIFFIIWFLSYEYNNILSNRISFQSVWKSFIIASFIMFAGITLNRV